MRRGKFTTCVSIAAALVFAAAVLAFAATQAPDDLVIKSALWGTLTKAPVALTHKKHAQDYKIACDKCHHVYKDGKQVWKQGDEVQKCEACHTEKTIQGEKKLPPDQQKLNLKLVFHKQCIDCHKETKKTKADTKAPITCAQCHPGAKAE